MKSTAWNPSIQYKKVAEANRRSYRRSAVRYDKAETCLVSSFHQSMLENDLSYVLSLIRLDSSRKIRALDACGGSGNVALKLLSKGADVTLCDISPEMIDIFESKCKERNISHYATICLEIGSYLASTDSKFDLIVFSSALHHIEDYTSVLKMALRTLNKKGFIYTVSDPIECGGFTRFILRTEMMFNAALTYPSEACMTARKHALAKLRHLPNPGSVEYEYYAKTGINDFALVSSLKSSNMEVVAHSRYADARFAYTRQLLSAFKRSTSFKLLIRNP